MKKSAHSSMTRSLLHDPSDIWRYPFSFPFHCYSKKARKGKLSVEELKESEFTWLRNRQRVVFLPEIEELCNKGQVNQKSRIVKSDPHFDRTKKSLVGGGRLQFAQIPEEAERQIIIPSYREIDQVP